MFKPNYKNIVDCAYNVKPERIPLYEHGISVSIMEKITGVTFAHLNDVDDEAFFKHYCEFFKLAGYDTVTFEAGIVPCLLNGGALTNQVCGSIKTMEDLNEYPFDEILDIFKKYYAPKLDAIRKAMPEGMKAIGGCGYGLFEIVQDLVGFENLCMIKYDDEELYSALFHKCGDFFFECWRYMVEEYSDVFCVFRFGDDLGYKMNTMLPPQDILDYLIPQYKRVIDLVHSVNKPFLLHSCGKIFSVMDDLINAGINAKHSNEDQIAPMSEWVEKYGDRIGNFGGVDTDHLVRMDNESLEQIVKDTYKLAQEKNGGFAIGSGNSIPDYVDVEKYLIMLNTVRQLRGDF